MLIYLFLRLFYNLVGTAYSNKKTDLNFNKIINYSFALYFIFIVYIMRNWKGNLRLYLSIVKHIDLKKVIEYIIC